MHLYYYLYKITNTVNQKIYIGVHKTKNLDDGYMGSGTRLKAAMKKYGLDVFVKDIIAQFETEEEMYLAEAALVTRKFLDRGDVYNLIVGGLTSGFVYCNERKQNLYGSNGQSGHGLENLVPWNIQVQRLADQGKLEAHYKKVSAALVALYERGHTNTFKGKHHTEETKRAIGRQNSIRQQGQRNSQYGTMWIHNETLKQSKKIKTKESVPLGWKRGRKIKW